MATRKTKSTPTPMPTVADEDMTEEEIEIYINSLPQQSKIMMHRNLAQWRNLTVDNVHKAMMRAWVKWNAVVHDHYKAEKAKADERSAVELKEHAISALNKPTHERSAMDVKTIVNWFRFSNIFGKVKPSTRALLVLAKEAAIWNGAPNTPVFFQGQRSDGTGPAAKHAWWQWGCYVLISGKVNLYSFSDRAQEAHALTRFVVSRAVRTPSAANLSVGARGGAGALMGASGSSSSLISDWNQDDEEQDDESSVYSANDGDPFERGDKSPAPRSSGRQPGSTRGAAVPASPFSNPLSPTLASQLGSPNVRFFPNSPNPLSPHADSSPMSPGGTPLNPQRTQLGVPIPRQLPSPTKHPRFNAHQKARGAAGSQDGGGSANGDEFENNEAGQVHAVASAADHSSSSRTHGTHGTGNLSTRSPLSFEPSSPAYLPPSAYATFFPRAQHEEATFREEGGTPGADGSPQKLEPGSPGGAGRLEAGSPGGMMRRALSRSGSFANGCGGGHEPLSPGGAPATHGGGGSRGRPSSKGCASGLGRSSSKGNLQQLQQLHGGGGEPGTPSLRRRGAGLVQSGSARNLAGLTREVSTNSLHAAAQGGEPHSGVPPRQQGSSARVSSRGSNLHRMEPDSNRSVASAGGGNDSVASSGEGGGGGGGDSPSVETAHVGVDFLTSGVLGDLIFSASGFGHTFGEVSLVDDSRPERSAAAVCAEPCSILVIGPYAFQRSLAEEYGKNLNMVSKMAFLEAPGGLFTRWRAAQLSQLAYVLKPVRFLPRDVLASQGQAIDCYYFVKEGTVRSVMTLKPAGGEGGGGGSSGAMNKKGGGKGAFEVDVGRMGPGSVVDDVGLIEGQLKYTATFVAESVVECFRLKVSEVDKMLANGIGPAKHTYRDIKHVAESRRELRFAKVSEAKRRYAKALDCQASEAKRAPPRSSSSSSFAGSGSNGAKAAGGGGGVAGGGTQAARMAHAIGKGRFTSAAYDVAWTLSQVKERKGHSKHSASVDNQASSRADPKTLANNVLKFTKVRGTGAESKEHLPTHSAFSLLQTINAPLED